MAIRYLSGINVDSNTLFVDDANNRVGIGTGSPVSSLNINNGDAWINVTDTLRGLQFGYAGPSHGSYRAAVMGGAESYGGTDSGMLTFHTQNGYVVSAIPPERMRITSAGNVGIGTTAPGAKLDVAGSILASNDVTLADGVLYISRGAGSAYSTRIQTMYEFPYINSYYDAVGGTSWTGQINFRTSANGSAMNTIMVLQNNGNVGIGTTSPAQKLHVVGNTTITGVTYTDIVQTYSGASIDFRHQDASVVMRVDTANARVGIGTTSPSYKLDVSGDIRSTTINLGTQGVNVSSYGFLSQTLSGQMTFLGHNVRASSTVNNTALVVNGGWISSLIKQYYNEGITFHTSTTEYAAGATYPLADTERMRITSAGNVGIGTTSPAYKLDVNGATQIQNELILSTNDAAFRLYRTTGINYFDWSSGQDLRFSTVTTIGGAGRSTAVTFLSDGNVGIGTTSPISKLTVLAASTGYSSDSQIKISDGSTSYYGGLSFDDSGATRLSIRNSYDGNGSIIGFGFGSSADKVQIIDGTGLIVNEGNVGIGTTSPVTTLQVNATSPAIRLQETGSGGDKRLELSVNSSGVATIAANQSAQVLTFETVGSERMRIASTGATRLNAYGSGSFTGTVAYNLAVDSSGNIIETAGGVVDGSGTANYVSKWQDANTLTISQLFDNGTDVGIGTSSPFVKFDVRGEAMLLYRPAGNAYAIYSAANNTYSWQLGINNGSDFIITGGGFTGLGTERLRITSDGNVGIGTTSPSYKLQVNGEGNGLYVIGANSAPYTQTIAKFVYGGNNNSINIENQAGKASFQARDNSDAAMSLLLNPVAGSVLIGTGTDAGYKLDVNGTGRFTGSITSNASGVGTLLLGSTSGSSQIAGRITATESPSYSSTGKIGFSVTTWGVGTDYGLTEVMAIDMRGADSKAPTIWMNPFGGNVGIGTTSPATKLHVSGGEIRVDAGQAITLDTSNGMYLVGASNQLRLYNGANPVVNITTAGNVGIGTTSPSVKLHIVGSSTTELRIQNSDANNNYGFIRYETSVASTGGNIVIGTNASGGGYGAISFSNANNVEFVGDGDIYLVKNGNVGIGTYSPSQKLHVTGNIRVTGAYYDSSNSAGSSGQVLSSTGSGTAWVNQGEATATSLYDLLPAARVAFNWTGQVVNDTWTTVFSKSSNLLTTGTWMVKMYVSDFATGGGHYTYTYSGMFTWYQDTTNQAGEQAASEIYLHRMGHAANASVLYLRTTETAAASSGDGLFQIKGNYSNTSNQTIQFQFVKIF